MSADMLAGIDDDLRKFIEGHEDREMYEHNIWIAHNVMGWKMARDELSNRIWETEFPWRVYWIDEFINFWRNLDACAIAEKKIAELDLQDEYVPTLATACFGLEGEDGFFLYAFGLATATSQQRCVAMYKIRKYIAEARKGESS